RERDSVDVLFTRGPGHRAERNRARIPVAPGAATARLRRRRVHAVDSAISQAARVMPVRPVRIVGRRRPSNRVRRAGAEGGVRGCSVVLAALALLLNALFVDAPATAVAAPLAHREVLPNGIVLLVAERPAVPIVAVRVSHQAGAVFDPPGRAGLANLTGAVIT